MLTDAKYWEPKRVILKIEFCSKLENVKHDHTDYFIYPNQQYEMTSNQV